jgi:hypothetical protein
VPLAVDARRTRAAFAPELAITGAAAVNPMSVDTHKIHMAARRPMPTVSSRSGGGLSTSAADATIVQLSNPMLAGNPTALRPRRVRPAVLIMLALAGGVWATLHTSVSAQPLATATLQVDTSSPGKPFRLGAVGLSSEASELATVHLSASHYRLVRLMRLLGPSVLRIGGNSVDTSWWTSRDEPPPTWATNTVIPADLQALRGLLQATGWKVILGVNLGHFEPARAGDEAYYAREILKSDLQGIEIGNEPDDFGRKPRLRAATYTVSEYETEARAYEQALRTVGVPLYGPALARTEWLAPLDTNMQEFAELTLHYYPASTCEKALESQEATAGELLSIEVRQQENEIVRALVSAGRLNRRPTRIGETNAAACTTSPASGPVFATALWSLDWALRASSAGVAGLNFHGTFDTHGAQTDSPISAPSDETASAGEVTAQPEFYGILAARLLEGGRFVPTRLLGAANPPNLTTWATLAANGVVKIAIDNFATSGSAQPIAVRTAHYTASVEALIGPSTGASTDIALGGASVTGEGEWHPKSAPLPARRSALLYVPCASAMIVTLSPRRRHRP